MTRLTIASPGDPTTFSPVTSVVTRLVKGGAVNVVNILFGTHYNISMDGILLNTTSGGIVNNSVGVQNSKLELTGEALITEVANMKSSFSSFIYFYLGTKIKGHLELDDAPHQALPVEDKYEVYYVFEDLVDATQLMFRVKRHTTDYKFELVELDALGTETIVHSHDLPGREVDFEFRYLEDGRSKLYLVDLMPDGSRELTKIFIGDLNKNYTECKVSVNFKTEENILYTAYSDYMYLNYPNIFLSYDLKGNDYFIGNVKMYDDMNEVDEALWRQIKSRDYAFVGNRVIENGIIRVVIKNDNPVIEIWGNDSLSGDLWKKVGDIVPISNDLISPLVIQNIVISHFNISQIRIFINFGTTAYDMKISKGSPAIVIIAKTSTMFKFRTMKNRFICDNDSADNYSISMSHLNGNPSIRVVPEEDVDVTMKDNWFSWYQSTLSNDMIGWMSNLLQPSSLKIFENSGVMEFLWSYADVGNIIAIGVIVGDPNITINEVPRPYLVANPDTYVKWRANEAVLAFKQQPFIRRRVK